ncbi:response regulator [Skermanella mucosa]|uniref:response regulator n=1 Tax=Skermanella mucosa TaxID=1789672 RepID=UPI00192B0AD5|nr:response regulator [Skermanella mucosa]UEM23114.1 response regulator [Skermanella mucosa]
MKILIAEDNALVALDLEQQVTDAGHTVVGIAGTAAEVLGLATDYGADLALMDVSLADGSSGIDAAVVLKDRFGVPSIFVTAALPDRPEVRRVAIGHLNKPYTEEEVVAAIQAVEATLRGEPPRSLPPRMRLFA